MLTTEYPDPDRGINDPSYRNEYGIDDGLVFPTPSEGNAQYKGRIQFIAFTEDYQSLGQILTRRAADLRNFGELGMNTNNTTDVNTGAPVRISTDKISLYLPSSIMFHDRVHYTDVDLGFIGTGVERALMERDTSVGALVRRAIDTVSDEFLPDIARALIGGLESEAAQIAAVRAAKFAGATGTQGAISTQTGIQINPNKRTMLQDVPIRGFQFNFKLIPASLKEYLQIKTIIKKFREAMYPEAVQNAGVSVAFRYPSKFQIKLFYGDKELTPGLLPCFLESVSTTYNSSSMGFHSGGEWTEVDISLMFKEERALFKQDVQRYNK